jgi:branched-chain amino acid transport system ATP-binding protein
MIMPDIILEAREVAKYFGGLRAVNGVNLQIQAGSLHSIIGPNGAGKTTLFNLLSGYLKPTHGHVIFNGRDITGLPLHRIAHLGLGRSFQITNVFPNLSVLENVRLAAQAIGPDNLKLWRSSSGFKPYLDRAYAAIEQVGLAGKEASLTSVLPHGDKRKLELAIILAADPKVLLLDEPTAGMASEQVPQLMEVIQHIRERGGKTIVLVEHNMNIVMRVSDRITVMHQGRVLAEGAPRDIAANEAVQTAYLGESAKAAQETAERNS